MVLLSLERLEDLGLEAGGRGSRYVKDGLIKVAKDETNCSLDFLVSVESCREGKEQWSMDVLRRRDLHG